MPPPLADYSLVTIGRVQRYLVTHGFLERSTSAVAGSPPNGESGRKSWGYDTAAIPP